MKRNGLRTVVVVALTIFLLNAPVVATASRLQDTCAEARDEVALRPCLLYTSDIYVKLVVPFTPDDGQ